MATPAPSNKVRDKEYANWLKVTLALYYMKSGLHTFIQSEIDCLHQSLVQKIYGGPTVPLPPCSMCDASHVIRNKYSGVWTFQKPCGSCCDVWLHELLKLHNNPKSEKIYWYNSHVPSWPFKPWECAKVYMPRGQLPSNMDPAECDAQALLMLLSSCTRFQHKLSPQGLNLSCAISTIRNQVMHDDEMKVSDADRTSFIQQIIQLLEDPVCLKSLEDCKAAVSNIHKIDNDSVDVFFNMNQEMTALSSVVKELSLEFGMQENKIMDNVDSLKEKYRQLREQLTNRFEDVEKKLELHGESTEKRFEGVEKKLELQGESTTKRFESVEKKLELQGESTTKRFEGVEKKLELQGERVQENVIQLHELEVNVELHQERLGTFDNKAELHVQRFGAIEENIEIHEERLGAVEQNVVKLQEEIGQITKGNNSCMQGQTEDMLYTNRILGYIPTTQAYFEQMYDPDLLVQERVSLTMKNLPDMVDSHRVTLQTVKKAVKHLKDTDNWDSKCDNASEALQSAYVIERYDVCDLLVQEGVSLTMKNLPGIVDRYQVSLEAVKKAVQHLKDSDNWDPSSNYSSGALQSAFRRHKYNVCGLLIQEGVSGVLLKMKNLPHMILASLDYVKAIVKQLQNTNSWDSKCDDASAALQSAYVQQNYDVCDLLVQEGVSLTMKNLLGIVYRYRVSLKTVKKAVKHLKDTDNWDPECDYASKALQSAYLNQKYDVFGLLVQEGVTLTMKNLPGMVYSYQVSLETVKKAVKHLKDTDNWDPKCDYASKALKSAYVRERYDVYDLLVQEGVSLTMKNLPDIADRDQVSLESVKKAVKHLKDTDNWNPKCDDASEALQLANLKRKYDVCDLLVQEGVSLNYNLQ